ncbi:MAG: histidine triad nucleotide-binding protein, partial [Deltaproteobacteria bacterium]
METDCIFCRIVGGGTDTEFIYQDEEVVVFRDIHPHAPVHLLIVP